MYNNCYLNNKEIFVYTEIMKKICKYQKRKGQVFAYNDLVRGFCMDAFYYAYPYCLAMLYNANTAMFARNEITFNCPHPSGISFRIKRVRKWNLFVRFVKRIFQAVFYRFIFPLEIEDWNIELKVIENKGGCPKQYGPGNAYLFNIRRLDELCPASFYSLYPSILLASYGINVPWSQEYNYSMVHCPDHEGMTYRIKTRPEV